MVSTDPGEAEAEHAAGRPVVLVVPPGAARPARPGLAVFVGDPADPASLGAAKEMDGELGSVRRR